MDPTTPQINVLTKAVTKPTLKTSGSSRYPAAEWKQTGLSSYHQLQRTVYIQKKGHLKLDCLILFYSIICASVFFLNYFFYLPAHVCKREGKQNSSIASVRNVNWSIIISIWNINYLQSILQPAHYYNELVRRTDLCWMPKQMLKAHEEHRLLYA